MPYDEKSRRPQHDVNEPEPELSEHETVIEWERLLDTTAKPQAETSSAAGEAEEFAFDRSRLPDPFAALRHSVWSAARWEDLSEGEHRGTATLAEGVTVDLHCRHDKQRLELAITGLPAGWRAESLALVEPRGGTQAGPLTAEQAARLAGETSEVLPLFASAGGLAADVTDDRKRRLLASPDTCWLLRCTPAAERAR